MESFRTQIADVSNDSDPQTVVVTSARDGLTISPEGFGVKTMEDDFNGIILLEKYEGRLRLLVWGDINEEDPTHIIDLEQARLSARRDDAA